MKFNLKFAALLLSLPLLVLGCITDDDGAEAESINILSIQFNGAELRNGADGLPIDAEIAIVFSRSLNSASFEMAFSLTSSNENPALSFTYANQSSQAIIDAELAFGTTYNLRILSTPIASDEGQLQSETNLSFTTTEDGSITSQPACTSATSNCLRTSDIMGDASGDFQFYSSFPIYEDQARWEEISAAIIVVHGVNRNGDDYFNYLMDALQSEGLEGNVLVISPVFKSEAEAAANELFWSGSGWREGRDAASGSAVSSFSIVDQLITRLGDEAHFPALEKIMVTGHSSGALFTHLYAAANEVEDALPALTFNYLVANSQYFYYPDEQRVNSTTNQLFTPTGCTGYNIWPLGYSVQPPYLASTTSTAFNERFLTRDVTYFLGNGNQADPSLNTTDCSATLLGNTRFVRGEQMFRYLELAYPGEEIHEKIIVDGVGHNGEGMYSSSAFTQLLNEFVGG